MKSLLRFLVCAGWVLVLLTRVDMFQSFGSGTGTNRIGFSPLDAVAHFSLQTAKLRGGESQIRLALQVVGVPGEVYREVLDTQGNFGKLSKLSPKQIWEQAGKWAREGKMKRVMNTRDGLSGFAALSTLLAAIVAPAFPKQASLLFAASLVALQFTLRVFESSVRLDETWGFYSIGLAFIGSII
ncbi:hypothetical protein BASA81_005497 [Batrachochytrium salamandrivorans]|nr:hypothetical protein BASA81_005497 [Batrachochytrium salamandrivorans]